MVCNVIEESRNKASAGVKESGVKWNKHKRQLLLQREYHSVERFEDSRHELNSMNAKGTTPILCNAPLLKPK